MTAYPAITLAVFIVLGGIWASSLLTRLVQWIRRDRQRQDAQTAADFGEPTRTEVEADLFWANFPAHDYSDTPIYSQLRREDDVWFAASVLADIDDLPGGAA